jgi:methylmalonyl-CoA mutase
MTDLSAEFKALGQLPPRQQSAFVTAASLFDGHDAAINIMRRILQSMGAEVIHLGHNRSVDEVVTAALQEDAQGIAISSYQGGHVEYFKYMVDLLKQRGGAHIQVFGGGGGVIVPSEIAELQAYGVTRIYSPEDGQRMGLAGMIGEMVMRCDKDLTGYAPATLDAIQGHTTHPGAPWRNSSPRLKGRGRKTPTIPRIAGAGCYQKDTGAGHYRHGRRGQIVAHRRADPPPAPGPGRRAACGAHQHRPQSPQERWCPAG